MSKSASTEIVCDLLKLMRGRWLDQTAIRRETGLSAGSVHLWCTQLVANGLLLDRIALRAAGALGPAPREYTLAPAWGGGPGADAATDTPALCSALRTLAGQAEDAEDAEGAAMLLEAARRLTACVGAIA